MNKPLETDAELLRLEEAIDNPAAWHRDPDLAADARLRRELARLPLPRLADSVSKRVVNSVRARRRAPWFAAAAAALALAGVLPLALQRAPESSPQPGAAEAAELARALQWVVHAGRQAGRATADGLLPALGGVDLGLKRLPLNLFSPTEEPQRSHTDETG